MILLTTSAEESAEPYIVALRSVGIRDDEITVIGPGRRTEAGAFAARASGIVLSGGFDVDPSRYGEEVLADGKVEAIPDRDELEWSVLDAARELHLPVWGVCRGLQVINVFLGGSLWQDLPSQHATNVRHAAPEGGVPHATIAHDLRITAPDSAFGALLAPSNGTPTGVNSRHHQAVKRLGTGLRPIAVAGDDLIEAVEIDRTADADAWWLRAVQWHPENLIDLPVQRTLWDDFAAAARRRAEEKT